MRVYTTDEAAEVLRVSKRTVERWIRSGELRGSNMSLSRGSGRPRMVVTEDELRRYMRGDLCNAILWRFCQSVMHAIEEAKGRQLGQT